MTKRSLILLLGFLDSLAAFLATTISGKQLLAAIACNLLLYGLFMRNA